ncbi:hypothetical protein ABW02_06755 [Niallia circulans]|uniref:Uncharacterized protein n=1 Tax=Niallia circulans TaxID=1397 RepID=A0A0J1IMT6_NIACI|nr:hypothetical protein [Niallia circulans]KLV27218.1 hypothetical protein ABW02_06755 [Niallia circulans]
MNHNLNLKCEVCKNVVRLKVYAGYVLENQFAFTCPECSITIDGYLIWNENVEGEFIKEFKCKNAKITEDENETHMLQIATEFFTDKIKRFDMNDPTMFFSPFIMDTVEFDVKQKKQMMVQYISDNFEKSLTTSLRIWELYKNQKIKYLNRQLILHKFVKPVPVGQVLQIDYLDTLREVIYRPFIPFLSEKNFLVKIKKFRELLNNVKKNHKHETQELYNDLRDLIENAEENLIHLLKNFSEFYDSIWPIILADIYKGENISEIKEKRGILTTNFENLKDYYVEAFEILCSLLPIYLGVQNIKNRGNRNKFEENISKEFKTIQSLKDYYIKVVNKGNKVKFFEKENIFTSLFDIPYLLNNIVRNSIGHHSYEYVADEQLIYFKDRNKKESLYLIEFSDLLYTTFYGTFVSLELVIFMKELNSIE